MNPSTSRVLAALVLLSSLATAQGDQWFTISATDDKLRRIDPYTGATLSATAMSVTNGRILSANGLATHPLTGELFAIVRTSNTSRSLAKLDPQTAVATVIGALPDQFAGITFDRLGTLYGVTGDGGNVPETLYTLSTTTAQATLFLKLGNGTGGEAIGFHPPTGLLFHASGVNQRNVDEIFESIDLTTKTITNVPLSHGDWDEALALTFFAGDLMLAVDFQRDLYATSITGVIDRIGQLDHDCKGIAKVRVTTGAWFGVFGRGCPAPSQSIAILGGSGVPSANASVTLRLRNAVPSSAAVLAFGLGTQQAVLSPGCQLVILPLSPILLVLPTDAGGSSALPLVMPSPALNIDLYLQAAQITGNRLSLTNALRLHPM
jgi:hypothetical protein